MQWTFSFLHGKRVVSYSRRIIAQLDPSMHYSGQWTCIWTGRYPLLLLSILFPWSSLCFTPQKVQRCNGLAARPHGRQPGQRRIVDGDVLDRSSHCHHRGFNEDVFAFQDQRHGHSELFFPAISSWVAQNFELQALSQDTSTPVTFSRLIPHAKREMLTRKSFRMTG